jgi:hypothetical protein
MKKLLNLLLLMVTTLTFAQGNGEDYLLKIRVSNVANNPNTKKVLILQTQIGVLVG